MNGLLKQPIRSSVRDATARIGIDHEKLRKQRSRFGRSPKSLEVGGGFEPPNGPVQTGCLASLAIPPLGSQGETQSPPGGFRISGISPQAMVARVLALSYVSRRTKGPARIRLTDQCLLAPCL
jgi:hypothetical protein